MLVDGRIEYETIGRFSQLPFRLAWAVTVHKSQGKTFDRVIIDIHVVFSPGQVYVALSRCTSLDGIVLARPIRKQFSKVDWKVHEFLAVRTGVEITENPVRFDGDKDRQHRHRELSQHQDHLP